MHLLLSNFPAFRTVCKCAGHCYSLWVCRTLLWTWDVAGPLLYHKGPHPTKTEETGISWNQLELAETCRVQPLYFQTCSLWSVDFPLGQPLDSHISPLGPLLVSLHPGTALVNSHLPTGTAFWLSRLPIGTTLGLSHLLLCTEMCHWQPAVLIKPNSGLILFLIQIQCLNYSSIVLTISARSYLFYCTSFHITHFQLEAWQEAEAIKPYRLA